MTMLGCIYDLLCLLHIGNHTRVHQNRVRGQGSKTTGTSFTSYITASRTPSRPPSFPHTPSPGLALTYIVSFLSLGVSHTIKKDFSVSITHSKNCHSGCQSSCHRSPACCSVLPHNRLKTKKRLGFHTPTYVLVFTIL